MPADKIRSQNSAELMRQVQDTQEQLFRLRFQMGMGQTEGVKKYRVLRKDRARLLTILREKELAGETIPPPLPIGKPGSSAAARASKQKKAKK